MKRIAYLFIVLALFVSCSQNVPDAPPAEPEQQWWTVSTMGQLRNAVVAGETKIMLECDVDLKSSGYTASKPFVLNLTGVTLDLGGHTICNVEDSALTGNSDYDMQSVSCSLNFIGDNFTVQNGTIQKSSNGGYGLLINKKTDKAGKYGKNTAHRGIVLSNLTIANGGLEVHGSTLQIKNCNFTQPEKEYFYDVATICLVYSNATIDGGTYNNYESLSNGYRRWIKLYYSSAYAKNGVNYNAGSSHFQYIEDSMFYVEKSTIGGELTER